MLEHTHTHTHTHNIYIYINYPTTDDDQKYGWKRLGRRYGTIPLLSRFRHKKNNKETWKSKNNEQCSIVFNKTCLNTHTHTHTHTHIYIYIYICVCVCVCVFTVELFANILTVTWWGFNIKKTEPLTLEYNSTWITFFYLYIYTHTNTHIQIHAHKHTPPQTYIYIYIYIYICL